VTLTWSWRFRMNWELACTSESRERERERERCWLGAWVQRLDFLSGFKEAWWRSERKGIEWENKEKEFDWERGSTEERSLVGGVTRWLWERGFTAKRGLAARWGLRSMEIELRDKGFCFFGERKRVWDILLILFFLVIQLKFEKKIKTAKLFWFPLLYFRIYNVIGHDFEWVAIKWE